MADDRVDGTMAEILLAQALGKDANSLWMRYFETVDRTR